MRVLSFKTEFHRLNSPTKFFEEAGLFDFIIVPVRCRK